VNWAVEHPSRSGGEGGARVRHTKAEAPFCGRRGFLTNTCGPGRYGGGGRERSGWGTWSLRRPRRPRTAEVRRKTRIFRRSGQAGSRLACSRGLRNRAGGLRPPKVGTAALDLVLGPLPGDRQHVREFPGMDTLWWRARPDDWRGNRAPARMVLVGAEGARGRRRFVRSGLAGSGVRNTGGCRVMPNQQGRCWCPCRWGGSPLGVVSAPRRGATRFCSRTSSIQTRPPRNDCDDETPGRETHNTIRAPMSPFSETDFSLRWWWRLVWLAGRPAPWGWPAVGQGRAAGRGGWGGGAAGARGGVGRGSAARVRAQGCGRKFGVSAAGVTFCGTAPAPALRGRGTPGTWAVGFVVHPLNLRQPAAGGRAKTASRPRRTEVDHPCAMISGHKTARCGATHMQTPPVPLHARWGQPCADAPDDYRWYAPPQTGWKPRRIAGHRV